MLSVLKARFEAYMPRHADLSWAAVKARLQAHPAALEALRRRLHVPQRGGVLLFRPRLARLSDGLKETDLQERQDCRKEGGASL